MIRYLNILYISSLNEQEYEKNQTKTLVGRLKINIFNNINLINTLSLMVQSYITIKMKAILRKIHEYQCFSIILRWL